MLLQNPNSNEQDLFEKIFCWRQKIKFKKIKIHSLDPLLFVNGDMFFNRRLNQKFKTKPLTVHINFVMQKKDKIDIFKKNNLWFI